MPKPASSANKSRVHADTRMLILTGSERYRHDEILAELRAALIAAHGEGTVDTVRYDGARGSEIIADILDECRSRGLMQPFKIVLVENAEQLVRAGEGDPAAAPPPPKPSKSGGKRTPARHSHTPRELLENYAEDPSDSAVLVLRSANWRPGNLDKAVEKIGAVIKCEPPSHAEAVKWARERCAAAHDSSIDADTADMLVHAVGADLGRLDTELEKLAVAAGGKGRPITAQLVQELVGVTREEEFWAIQAALVSGRADRILAQLRELIDVSRHDPVPIAFSYADMARKLHIAADGLRRGVPEGKLIPAIKLWKQDQLAAAIFGLARALGPEQTASLLRDTIKADAANKSGLGEPARNLERLSIRFARLAARR